MSFAPRGIPFRNDSGQTIPAYGVMRVTGVTVVQGMPVLTVDQPDQKFHRTFLLNGPVDVPGGSSGNYGTAQDGSYPAIALYDDSTLPQGQNNPNLGDHWGADQNSWKLVYGREGFYVLGGSYGDQGGSDGSTGQTSSMLRTIVRPYAIQQAVVRLTNTLNQGGTATGTLQKVTTTNGTLTYSDTSITSVTVLDGFMQSGQQLMAGILVFCAQVLDGDKLLAVQANACPTAQSGS